MCCVLRVKAILSRAENLDRKKFMMCVLGLKSILSRAENLDKKVYDVCIGCQVNIELC